MNFRVIIPLIMIPVLLMAFDLPKNQQPQQLGSPYYAELINKHVVKSDAKIAFLPSRFISSDAEFINKNTGMKNYLTAVDSFLISNNLAPVNLNTKYKETDLPEMYFGTISEVIDVPLYVNRMPLEGQSPNMIVMAGYRGKKKFQEELKIYMNTNQIDYVVVPILRESFIYPSAPVKEIGIFSSTTASAKKYFIDLGTNHVIKGEKLQSLNDPISVFVISMAMINKEGKMVSMVTEGIGVAPQSKFVEQILNIRTMFGLTEIDALFQVKRDDLETNPKTWEEACKNALLHLKQNNKFIPAQKYQFIIN